MPVATLCAAASSGSARVPEPAIDSSTHVVSFVTLETRAIKDFEPAAAKTFPHGTKYRPTPDREAFNHKTLRLQIQPARYPQMRPQHHVQPLTNTPGHAQEPHERYRCKTTTKPTAATHQPPATETALEGAQEPSKTLGLGASARCISSMGIFFTFLTKQWKVQGGGAANHGLTNTCAATLRLPCVPRAGLGKPWSASNANKPASSWLPKQDPKN